MLEEVINLERKPGIKLDPHDQRLIRDMIHEGNPNNHDIQPLTDEMEADRQKHLERQNHMGG